MNVQEIFRTIAEIMRISPELVITAEFNFNNDFCIVHFTNVGTVDDTDANGFSIHTTQQMQQLEVKNRSILLILAWIEFLETAKEIIFKSDGIYLIIS